MLDLPFSLLPLLSVISSVIVLRVVGLVTDGISFETWGAAFGAVVLAYFVGWGAMYLVMMLAPEMAPMDPSTYFMFNAGLQVVLNFVSLGIAAAVMSGIRIKGMFGLLIAAVVLTAINVAMTYLPTLLALTD